MGSKSTQAKTTVRKVAAKKKATTGSTKAATSSKKPLAAVKKNVSSRAKIVQADERRRRSRFVAGSVAIAALLVALLVGLMGYTRGADSTAPEVAAGSGIIYLKHVSGSDRSAGSTFTVDVYENSGTESVNALQSSINYPEELLEVVSVSPTASFPQEAATDKDTPGLLRIARAVKTQSDSVKGAHAVTSIEFKLKRDAASPIQMSVDNASSLLVRSTDNKNILSTTGTNDYSL